MIAHLSARGFGLKTILLMLGAWLANFMFPVRAAVIYSGLQNIGISTDFTGVYLDLDAGTTGTGEFTGWDINPFFGGVGVANSPAFQPARTGTGTTDTILNLGSGTTVNVGRFFSTSYGGSQNHLGTQFTAGLEGYLGFQFTTNSGAGPYYGWMRVIFTGNTAGALIEDWAYENSGGAIVTGRVQQGAASGGTQVVTLSPGNGESFTLGSAVTNTGGNINSMVKTGQGTAILATANTYTGGTTLSGGVLRVSADAALGTGGGVTISNGATLQAGATFTSSRSFMLGAGGGVLDTNGNAVSLSNITGASQTLTKTGGGTLNLSGTQSYGTLAATAGTTNVNSALGSGAKVNVTGTGTRVNFGTVSQTLGSLTIGAGDTVTFSSGTAAFADAGVGQVSAESAVVPEPCTVGLLLLGSLGFMKRCRRPRR